MHYSYTMRIFYTSTDSIGRSQPSWPLAAIHGNSRSFVDTCQPSRLLLTAHGHSQLLITYSAATLISLPHLRPPPTWHLSFFRTIYVLVLQLPGINRNRNEHFVPRIVHRDGYMPLLALIVCGGDGLLSGRHFETPNGLYGVAAIWKSQRDRVWG